MLTNVARPCSIAGDDAGEVVVEEDQVGGLPGHVGARPAHGDADVGLVQRGRVVDAVAGHRHDVPPRPQGPGDAQLVLRGDPGDHDAVVVEEGAEDPVVVGQVGPDAGRDRLGRRRPTSVGDGGGRRRVVAGHHRHADAGPAAGGERLADVVARRVLERRRRPSSRRPRSASCGDARQGRSTGRARRWPAPAAPARSARRPRRWPPRPSPHSGQHRVGRALDEHLAVDDDRHPARRGSNGKRSCDGVVAAVGVGVDAQAAGEGVERRLHRVAVRAPLARRPGRRSRWSTACRASASAAHAALGARRRPRQVGLRLVARAVARATRPGRRPAPRRPPSGSGSACRSCRCR